MGPESAYIRYWKIEQNDYWKKIELFENEVSSFQLLDYEDRKSIEQDYLNAIFEIGKYEKYLLKVDPQIEEALETDQELFSRLLSKKAAAFYNLDQFKMANSLSLQVLAIDPANILAAEVLLQCIRKEKSPNYHYIKAIANFLLLLSAGIIATTWLFVIPFYPEAQSVSKFAGKSLLTISIAILLFNELLYFTHGKQEWKKQLKAQKLRYEKKRRDAN